MVLDRGCELPVGREPLPLESLLPVVEGGTLPGVALSLDEGPVLTREPAVLTAAHLVERFRAAAHDMGLVVEDPGLGRGPRQRVAEEPPHVHRGELHVRRTGERNFLIAIAILAARAKPNPEA